MTYPVRKNISQIDVTDFGADPTGASDSSQAFKAAWLAAINADFGVGPGTGDSVTRCTIAIPSGVYAVSEPESLIAPGGVKQVGAEIVGYGMPRIVYTGTGPLIHNANTILTKFEGIGFQSLNPSASFMKSVSTPGTAGLYRFDRCHWTGEWAHGIKFEGQDLNSDNVYNECRISAKFQDGFLFADSATGSDQTINHDFYGCSIWLKGGKFVNFEKGGAIGINGGSFISVNPSTFFHLKGTAHGFGVARLTLEGVHVEVRDTSTKVIDCEWQTGTILFSNYNESSNTFQVGTSIAHKYNMALGGPVIKYDNCALHGQHEYTIGTQAFERHRRVTYDTCNFEHYDDPRDAVLTVDTSTNFGSHVPIRFERCSGRQDVGSSEWQTSGTVNWSTAHHSEVLKRIAVVNNPQGGLPANAGSESIKIPKGALITGVKLFCPPGVLSSASTGWSIAINSGAGILASLSPGTPLSAGYDLDIDLCIPVVTDTDRTITVQVNGLKDASDVREVCWIEYVG